MSLLVDQDFVDLPDLLAIDPEISEVANAEEITVMGDGSITRQSWDESADILLDAIQAFGGDVIAWPGSITTFGAFGVSRPRLRLNQIVVSAAYGRRYSPLRRWMIYRALVLFYRAASNRRTSDRYQLKWDSFKREETAHWKTLWSTGLPMVAIPLACPGAVHEYMAGDWGASNVSFAAGGTNPATSYDVAITWVAAGYVSPQNAQNAESGPSGTASVTVPGNNFLTVNINGLNPPGQLSVYRGIADGPYITRVATGWNVYAGLNGGTLYLQNATPIPVATQTYTFSAAPVLTGSVLPSGQMPDANYAMQRILQRG